MWGSQGWNQWALQPAMFNDIPHEQIDWAELAKQWIQMKQAPQSVEMVQPVPPPLPPPLPPQVPAPPSTLPPPPPGHVPLMAEEFPEKRVSPPLLKTPVTSAAVPELFHEDEPYQNESAYLPKTGDSNFWSKPEWEEPVPNDLEERLWPAPTMEPPVSVLAGKETFDYGHVRDNPPLAMQSIDYNHMSEFSYSTAYPTPAPMPESHYDQYWSQVNVAPAISPMFLKKERSTSAPVEEESNQIDAAKRKTLPAWIRDGLEKMEQERLKRLEKEREAKEHAEKAAKTAALQKELNSNAETSLVPAKSKFESDSEEGEVEPEEIFPKRNLAVEKRQPSPVEDLRTDEEKKQDLMLKVRRTLTEVLLSVTNSEMVSIAQDMLRKAITKAPARQLASSTSLSSVASGLRGLASYGTESEASEAEEEDASDSDEDLYRKIKEKKKLFALKERKIIADLEEKELEEKINLEKRNNEKKSNKEHILEKPDYVTNEVDKAKKTTIPFLESEPQSPPKEAQVNPEDLKETKVEETNADTKIVEKKNSKAAPVNKPASSDSSSSSSDSDSDSSIKRKKKAQKDDKKDKGDQNQSNQKRKDKKSSRKDGHSKRSRSRDSNSSGKHRRERSRDRKSKKKKHKRSDSSSSSSSPHKKSRRSSKYESSRSHKDSKYKSYHDRDRKRRRSASPSRSHRKSDDHSSRSRKYEEERHERKYKEEKRHRDHRHSPSPHRGSKLPRKYRSSRSLSSESENSGKKSKKSRNR